MSDPAPTPDALAACLPCPFCGSAPTFCADDSYGTSHVLCQQCDIGTFADIGSSPSAVEKWNRRAVPPSPDAEAVAGEWMHQCAMDFSTNARAFWNRRKGDSNYPAANALYKGAMEALKRHAPRLAPPRAGEAGAVEALPGCAACGAPFQRTEAYCAKCSQPFEPWSYNEESMEALDATGRTVACMATVMHRDREQRRMSEELANARGRLIVKAVNERAALAAAISAAAGRAAT